MIFSLIFWKLTKNTILIYKIKNNYNPTSKTIRNKTVPQNNKTM